MDGGELDQVNGLDVLGRLDGLFQKEKKKFTLLDPVGSLSDQSSPFLHTDCSVMKKTRFVIWWRHLAPKEVAPILNVAMDWHKNLMNCTTVSDGYFDTLWAFLDVFYSKERS